MIIPAFLTRFRQEHPDIRFEILQQRSKPGQQSQNHVDLFLSSSINPIENDHSVTLLKEDIMLAMPDTDPHARKSSVNLDEFEKPALFPWKPEPAFEPSPISTAAWPVSSPMWCWKATAP